MGRSDVSFQSGGTECAAWLYRPEAEAPRPLVVMAHGFSATRELGLEAYAERFCAAGLGVLLFDYRHFGASGGEPRQLLDISRQHADFRRALAYARDLDWVDPERVGLCLRIRRRGVRILSGARRSEALSGTGGGAPPRPASGSSTGHFPASSAITSNCGLHAGAR